MSERGESDGDAKVFAALGRERHVLSIDDILTEEQRAELLADLARMAQQRRRAEAESANVWLA